MNTGILTSSYAPPLMPRGLLGRPTPVPTVYAPPGWHPEAQDWLSRVIANGGEVSPATFSAVNQFCNDIDAAGLRDRFYRLNLFCGSSLSSCLVPLYRARSSGAATLGNATDTNNNFVARDFIETGAGVSGLKGNGSTKYLDTGLNLVTIGASVTDSHLSVYTGGVEAVGTSRYIVSSTQAGSGGPGIGLLNSGTNERYHTPARVLDGAPSRVGVQGLLGGSASDSRAAYYVNGRSVASLGGGSGSFDNRNLFVFAGNTGTAATLYTLARYVRAYSIGLNLSDAQWAMFNYAMQSFQAALGRNV